MCGNMGSGSASASANSTQSTASKANISNEDLKALNDLDTVPRISEIKSVLETMDDKTTFYQVSERGGVLLGINKITKNGEDSYTVNGVNKSASELARNIRDGSKNFSVSQPDTSSHNKITGRKTETYDDLKFKSGTFDVAQHRNPYGKDGGAKVRKVELSGKITTYDGVQYGVNKRGGEYFTTHLPTGMLIGRGQKTMEGVASQIKETSKRLSSMDLKKATESFKNTIRGD